MIGKEKVAKVIPNAILLTTETEKHFLTSFTSRDKAYLMLFRIWQNALMDKSYERQELWQWVISLYIYFFPFIKILYLFHVIECLIK